MADRFCVTVLTYNRAETLRQNLPSYLDQDADLLRVMNNGSTDETHDIVEAAFAATSQPTELTKNRINLGYARSLVKSFLLCEQDYQVFLSDEDVPNSAFLKSYRDAVQKFGPRGVIVRAAPYPKKWSIAALDERHITHQDDAYTVIAPGSYAAHLASFQSVYVGGLCVAPAFARNINQITLEQGSYPQRFLAMDAAYHGGLVLVKQDGLGQFPGAFASKRKEAMTPRNGDWGVAEYIDTAQFMLDFYDHSDVAGPEFDAMRRLALQFAYTRVPIYFSKVAVHGVDAAFRFLEAVGRTSDVFTKPLFWSVIYAHMNNGFDPKMRGLFRECCRRLESEEHASMLSKPNAYHHQHLGFGRL